LSLEENEELEDKNDEEIEEEGFDKDELEHDEEFKEEHEVVSGPTNLPTKKLKSCLASKSQKVMKSPFKKQPRRLKTNGRVG
jgi:hypothetical protein